MRELHDDPTRPTMGRWLTTLLLTTALLLASIAPVVGAEGDIDDLGTALVEEFVEIATLSDADKQARLEDYLAPEFQIVRASGEVLDKVAYVANPSSVLDATVTNVAATQDGDVLVVSWSIEGVITIDGTTSASAAPRLSVFHRGDDGTWRLAAHANFIPPELEDGS